MTDVIAKSDNGNLRVREVTDYRSNYGPEDDGGVVRMLLSEKDGEYFVDAEHNTEWFNFDAVKIADNLSDLGGDANELASALESGESVLRVGVREFEDDHSVLVSIAMVSTVNENGWTIEGVGDAIRDDEDFLDWADNEYLTLILESRRIVTDLHKGTVNEYWSYVDSAGPVLVENVLEAAEDFLSENT